jgi:hypothetical protein
VNNHSSRVGDTSSRARDLEEESDAVRDKLEKNLTILQRRVRRNAPALGIAGLVVAGLVGGGLAFRAARRARTRDVRHRLQRLLTHASSLAKEPQRLAHSHRTLRQRAIWAGTSMLLSVLARRFARNALVP